VLRNLSRGHALVHGRTQLATQDIPCVASVAISSMPPAFGRVFMALVEKAGEPLTGGECQATLDVKHPATARKVMEELDRRGVALYAKAGPGKPATLTFHRKWNWCSARGFAALLRMNLSKIGVVCGGCHE